MGRFLTALFIAVVTSFPAAGSSSSVSIGVWSGPGYYGPPYRHYSEHRRFGPPRHAYGYPYYYPRRSVFVYSAPVYAAPVYPVYAPPPVIAYPSYSAAPIAPTAQCTTFNGDATIDGSGTPFFGRACIFTDGRWHIVP